MRTQLFVAVFCITTLGSLSTVSHAQVQSTVPIAQGAAPGSGTSGGAFNSVALRYQFLIDETQLVAHLGNALTAISFRLPTSAMTALPVSAITFANYEIWLSKSVDPSARSTSFVNNVIGAQTQVRSGALTISAGSFSSGSLPNNFGPKIGLDSSYQYDGGDLLIDVRYTGGTGSIVVDAMLAGGGQGYGTLFSALSGTFGANTGNASNFAVLQVSSVPEPATAFLVAAGVLAVVARRRATDRRHVSGV